MTVCNRIMDEKADANCSGNKGQKMKGYLIEKYTDMGNAYTTARLLEEAKKAGLTLTPVGVEDTAFVDGTLIHQGKKLEDVDFVINRYKYGVIKDCINGLAKRQYNELKGLNRFVNKANELISLAGGSLCFPRYILGRQGISYEEIADCLGLPFVAKGLLSSQGREVFLISGKKEYQEIRGNYGEEEVLFQEFIKSSYGRDVRFFLLRGEVLACMERRAKDGFRANFALGGSVAKYEINDRIREIGKEIYEKTELDLLGVDLLFGGEDYMFCEINVTPGIEGMERACGVNAAGEIIACAGGR